MNKIAEFFVNNTKLFWSVVVGILIAGYISFVQMPKLEDPPVAPKQAMVVVVYPGATASQVELKVAQKMEDQLRTLPDVHELRTDCEQGMAKITVEFEMTVLNKDLQEHYDILRRKTSEIASQLPQECYAPIVIDDIMDVYGIFYSLTGDGYSYADMERYARLIQRELVKVKGVKRVNIAGTRKEVINIILDKDKLARNGMIPTQIMMSLNTAGKTVSTGKYASGQDRLQLRINNQVDNEDDIRNLLIRSTDGKPVRLGDIAKIERTYEEPQTNGFFVNGKPSLAICLTMNDNVIVPDVGKAVDAKLAETMKRLPAGITTDKIFFQPDKVNEAINGFMVNLVESVIIVILVLIFSMGWRSGVIIGTGLLLTITVSFPILLTLGTTLQRISLGAFIIAMGMLVDNSIVIMDGILVDKQRGLKDYLFNIGRKSAIPLLGATIIAASTFISVYMSPDSAGEYCRDMFLVLCVSLLASWVLALVQVPVCAKQWLPAKLKVESGELKETKMQSTVRRIIEFLIGWKKTTAVVAFVVLILCFAGMSLVKNMFFSDFDYKQFIVECQYPPQTSPDKVKADLLKMSAEMQKDKRITRVAAAMGNAPAHYCLVRPMTSGGDSYGELMVDCPDFKTVEECIPGWKKRLREEYPDAYIRFRKYNFSISTSHTVEAIFRGPDPAVLKDLSNQAERIMRNCKYVDKYSVGNNWHPKGKAMVADYVRQDALGSNLERSNIADAFTAATDGLPCGVLYDQQKMVVVNMMIRNHDGSKIKDLKDIPVWSMMNVNIDPNVLTGMMTGALDKQSLQDNMFKCVPLSSVAPDMHLDWENSFIYRMNGERAIEAQCDPNPDEFYGTTAKVVSEIQDSIEAIHLPEGYSMIWGGETKTQNESNVNVVKFLPITLFLMFFLLLFLFKSWREVGLVVLCFPFVFCGIVPALLIFRQPFAFMAIIALMGLIGMMTKNTIVLIDEINRRKKEALSSNLSALSSQLNALEFKAVVGATVSRVRPVIMASLTTIVGMAPLLGDPMYNAMAVCIMSGLTMGTIITLILLPVFYCILFKVKRA